MRFCQNCGNDVAQPEAACPACGALRIVAHDELAALNIAHVDCDAFYASVEKRDDPALRDRPVIVGGGVRGVVTTACYIARTYGVKSAMPMFKALKACPQAVVIKPDFAKYLAASRDIRERMLALSPLVEPLSIDEAFIDLAGTERVHGAPPAKMLARLQSEVANEVGVTISVGLSHNKFLAKIASDLDKPSGFAVIGKEETRAFLASQPVSLIWGIGAATEARLRRDGFARISDLQAADERRLVAQYGELGLRLSKLSRGEDYRPVKPRREAKSVSAETTFNADKSARRDLEAALWPLCEKVSSRMKEKGLAGRVVTLKLKTANFRTLTRRVSLDAPSNLADTAYKRAAALLGETVDGGAFRLIGVGYCDLSPAEDAAQFSLFEDDERRIAAREDAIDAIRRKFGEGAIGVGRGKFSGRNRDDD